MRRQSPNSEPRRSDIIDMLVFHYTGMPSAQEALDRLCDPESKVSAHFLIDEDGTTHNLVPVDRRAWHAGVSFWRGETDINSRSIGIEIVNPGHEFGYRHFPQAQIDALIDLSLRLLARFPIHPRNVVAHSDIAPSRKQDPGELFPWDWLKGYGIGLYPFDGTERAELLPDQMLEALRRFGYDISNPVAAVAAFQRHYRPARVDGMADRECMGRVLRLLEAVGEDVCGLIADGGV